MRSQIVVVGASGRVGRLVVASWGGATGNGPHCVAQFRHPEHCSAAERVGQAFLHWDPASGAADLEASVKASGPFSAMIVLAGATPGRSADLAANRVVAEQCLRAASEVEIPRVLVASSSAVYGVSKSGEPFREFDDCRPVSDYGRAKLEMEACCEEWRERGLEVNCLRIGNVAGADALLLNLAAADSQTRLEIDIFPNGEGPIRSYIGPQSLSGVLKVLSKSAQSLPAVINLAAPHPISMISLADAAGAPWKARPIMENKSQKITLDCNVLRSLYKFKSFESSAEEVVRQWRDVK
ncbi:NAD-dependent epimerase/dehydratase family protein [Qipengyuania sp. R86523]|uniref:NAD-dependent epimerase/dehydratase family protein n=1 Tax=Qipengyuania sp. R86523 TaxID=3093862 RepID=UPI0037C9675E